MRRADWKERIFAAAFLAPALVLFGVFVVWPLTQVFVLSQYRFRGISSTRTYVGAQYFQNLWTDPVFWKALTNGLILVVVGSTVILALGLVLAHATTAKGGQSKLLRSVYLFPQVVSVVAVAVLWRFVVHPTMGLVPGPENGWLGDTSTAWWVVVFVFVWMNLGFYTMLFGTGISSVPQEVTEAAKLEGVEGWKRFQYVTWPLLWPVRRVAAVYVIVNSMNCFALVNVMVEGGGPSRSAEVMLNYLYELMQESQFGKAAAVGVVNFGVAVGLALLLMLMFRKNPEAGSKAA